MSRTVVFLYFDSCEVLDFAGPLQAFHEAQQLGAGYVLASVAPSPSVTTAQGLVLAQLAPLPEVGPGTLVLVPGYPVGRPLDPRVVRWVARAAAQGARLASVCTGAFVLGAAGLLAGRRCTTHWKRTEELQAAYPEARVVEGRLFVDDGVVTSGGLTSGIDLALALLEDDLGPERAARVARELVVYLRRDGDHEQLSPFLEHRNHLHPAIHRVQDRIVAHPERPWTLETLAVHAALSPRHLTRTFRRVTGLGLHDYLTAIRIEKARTLLAAGDLTVEAVAAAVGFSDGRQLRRLWNRRFGAPPRGPEPGSSEGKGAGHARSLPLDPGGQKDENTS